MMAYYRYIVIWLRRNKRYSILFYSNECSGLFLPLRLLATLGFRPTKNLF
jgi:hypothetical protein